MRHQILINALDANRSSHDLRHGRVQNCAMNRYAAGTAYRVRLGTSRVFESSRTWDVARSCHSEPVVPRVSGKPGGEPGGEKPTGIVRRLPGRLGRGQRGLFLAADAMPGSVHRKR